jgi:hypothetical protein
MGREIRRVPANWEHPKNGNGKHQPMYYRFYGDALNEWLDNKTKWDNGTHHDLIEDPSLKEKYPNYADWSGEAPNKKYYRQVEFSEDDLTHIQLYENVTEGTPMTPVFKADEFEKLCEYASKNCYIFGHQKASKDDWMLLLSDESAFVKCGDIAFL